MLLICKNAIIDISKSLFRTWSFFLFIVAAGLIVTISNAAIAYSLKEDFWDYALWFEGVRNLVNGVLILVALFGCVYFIRNPFRAKNITIRFFLLGIVFTLTHFEARLTIGLALPSIDKWAFKQDIKKGKATLSNDLVTAMNISEVVYSRYQLISKDNTDTLDRLLFYSQISKALGDSDNAKRLYQEAIESINCCFDDLGSDFPLFSHEKAIRVLRLHLTFGNYREAFNVASKGLKHRNSSDNMWDEGGIAPEVEVEYQLAIAEFYIQQGNYDKALNIAQDAQKLAALVKDGFNILYLRLAKEYIAKIYFMLGDISEAHKIAIELLRSEDIISRILENGSIALLQLISQTFNLTGDLSSSEKMATLALGEVEKWHNTIVKRYGKLVIPALELQIIKGELYELLGKDDVAIKIYESSYSGLLEKFGADHSLTMTALSRLGFSTLINGNREDSLRLLKIAQAYIENNFPPMHKLVLSNTYSLSKAYRENDFNQEANDLMSSQDLKLSLWFEKKSQLGLTLKKKYYAFELDRLNILLDWYVEDLLFDDAYIFTERHKARFLLEKINFQVAVNNAGLLETEQNQLKTLSEQVQIQEAMRTNIANNTKLDKTIREQRLNEVIVSHNKAIETLMVYQDELAAKHPKFDQLLNPPRLDAEESAKALGKYGNDTQFVSFYQTKYDTYVLLLTEKGEPKAIKLDVNNKSLEQSVHAYQQLNQYGGDVGLYLQLTGQQLWQHPDGGYVLSESKPEGAHRFRDRLQSIAPLKAYLSDTLLKPIWSEIKDHQHLLISPDGNLSLLAFETLTTPDGGALIEKHDISYTPSLSIWALTHERQVDYNQQQRYPLYAMANPDYQTNDNQYCQTQTRDAAGRFAYLNQNRAAIQATSLQANVESDVDGIKRDGLIWCPLPGTAKELSAVSKILNNKDNQIFLTNQANEGQIKQDNQSGKLKQYQYLHFATHGYLDDGAPLNSAIVLTPEQQEDGYLTGGELAGLNLNSDLTVMSACNTAANESEPGQGVAGLPFALYLAGNQSTLMTLWAIDDAATAEYMTRFYEYIAQGKTPMQANNAVKREFIKHEQYNNPSYWAPFVFYGI